MEERKALGGDEVRVLFGSEAREVFGEDSVRVVAVVVGKKCEAMVPTSIALLCRERERERE